MYNLICITIRHFDFFMCQFQLNVLFNEIIEVMNVGEGI